MLRITKARRVALALAVTTALALPAAASADDQSVYNSFHSSHPRFQELRRDFERGRQHWEDSNWRDPSDAYRACRRTVSLAHKVVAKMQGKHTSSDTGTDARRRAVLGVKYRGRWADAEQRAIKAFMDFDGNGYIDLDRKAQKHLARAQSYEAEAQKLFKQAGVKTNP